MNNEDSDIEDLLYGVYERMREHKRKEKTNQKPVSEPYVNPYPFSPSEGEVMVAFQNIEGVWVVR